jgi:HSF-type DNA-binding
MSNSDHLDEHLSSNTAKSYDRTRNSNTARSEDHSPNTRALPTSIHHGVTPRAFVQQAILRQQRAVLPQSERVQAHLQNQINFRHHFLPGAIHNPLLYPNLTNPAGLHHQLDMRLVPEANTLYEAQQILARRNMAVLTNQITRSVDPVLLHHASLMSAIVNNQQNLGGHLGGETQRLHPSYADVLQNQQHQQQFDRFHNQYNQYESLALGDLLHHERGAILPPVQGLMCAPAAAPSTTKLQTHSVADSAQIIAPLRPPTNNSKRRSEKELYSAAVASGKRGILEPFPEKLHRLLTETGVAGNSDIISFIQDGKAFAIHKPDKFFRDIVPEYFKQSRLSSFKRQLNLYGFEIITGGISRGGYFHKSFLKDRPDLCRQIKRRDIKFHSRPKNSRSETNAPDFYNMPPITSSEDAKESSNRQKSVSNDKKGSY